MELKFTDLAKEAIDAAVNDAKLQRVEFVTPEHLLYFICAQEGFENAMFCASGYVMRLEMELDRYFETLETFDESVEYEISFSYQLSELLSQAGEKAASADRDTVNVLHLIDAMLSLEDSYASNMLLKHFNTDRAGIIEYLTSGYSFAEQTKAENAENEYEFDDLFSQEKELTWKSFVTCLNDEFANHNPLIGREEELERTIQILCRKDKNNPLHIGEPGVGKTALAYGLAAKIVAGDVPEKLQGCHIYSMDMGTILAGTQFRGDFEKRIKQIMEGARLEGNAIIYIDEIHNMVGAGQTSEGSLDASNMLKPYLEGGSIRFIGSTTYQEYNRYFSKSKGIVRRFQQIDIQEPTEEETIKIIEGLIEGYQRFHGVSYADGLIRYVVEKSSKLIADRFLPDKAIDIIDEAGAYRQLHPMVQEDETPCAEQIVDEKLVRDILAKVCKIDAKALSDEDNCQLENLSDRISSKIFGQDEAVKRVVEAVQMSKAGLLEADKPLASLLFVGPTGVGKTEVCKVLAKELGIELVRFDMSEYTEKHAVAKLIGSPAGYVGYEDGGMLTDAIRKTPNCVLLLDELEKAHPDIYNILLQVMDYARLTDNKGNKADFRNVILVMTSNAGAQFAHQASVGFSGSISKGEAMMQTVRKTFKPEFLNRLSGTVIFNDMNREMAALILRKKLNQLQERLNAKNVTLQLADDAFQLLLDKGYSARYGAREMDRVIQNMLNPLLMHEILFGMLRSGGMAEIITDKQSNNGLRIRS